MQRELEPLEQDSYRQTLAERALPQLIFFAVEWSEPCRQMQEVMERLAGAYCATADFCSVDTDQQPLSAADFHITNVPTLVVWRQGEVLERIVGIRQPADLERSLSKYLK